MKKAKSEHLGEHIGEHPLKRYFNTFLTSRERKSMIIIAKSNNN